MDSPDSSDFDQVLLNLFSTSFFFIFFLMKDCLKRVDAKFFSDFSLKGLESMYKVEAHPTSLRKPGRPRGGKSDPVLREYWRLQKSQNKVA